MKVLWFLLAGLFLGHIFAAGAPQQATEAVERTVERRYVESLRVAAAVMPSVEEDLSQWAFLNNFVAIFVMAYGGLLLTYPDFGPEMKRFYRLMERVDKEYKVSDYKDGLFSLQIMPYGGSFINGALVGYIARKAEVSFLKHIPFEEQNPITMERSILGVIERR